MRYLSTLFEVFRRTRGSLALSFALGGRESFSVLWEIFFPRTGETENEGPAHRKSPAADWTARIDPRFWPARRGGDLCVEAGGLRIRGEGVPGYPVQ